MFKNSLRIACSVCKKLLTKSDYSAKTKEQLEFEKEKQIRERIFKM
jgi:hypothetical protein